MKNNMEFMNSPGLFHIVVKLIPYSNETKFLETIGNLRLVCKNWNDFVESESICRLLLHIARKHGIFCKEVNDVFNNIFEVTLENPQYLEEKVHWHLSQLILKNWNPENSPKSHLWEQNMLKVDDIKSLVFGYLRSNSRAIKVLKNVYGIMSHAHLDIVKIFHQRKIKRNLISRLMPSDDNLINTRVSNCLAVQMKFAIFHSCRPEIVKFLLESLHTDSRNLEDPTGLKFKLRNCVTEIIWVMVHWPEMNLEIKTKFIEMVDLLMENIDRTDVLLTMADSNFTFERLRDDLIEKYSSASRWQQMKKNYENVGLFKVHNPFLMVLYHDKNQNNFETVKIFAKILKSVKHPIEEHVLEIINFYAAIKGYAEVMKVVAEKVGKSYVNFAKRIVKDFVHKLNQEVLDFLAKIIHHQN